MSNLFKFKIGGIFERIKRSRRLKEKDHKGTKTAINADDLRGRRRISWGKIILFFLVFLLIYYFGPIIYSFASIELEKGKGDSKIVEENLSASRMNIALIGLDTYDSEYSFIDAVVLVSYDFSSRELGVFAVNPDIRANIPAINRQIELRRFLNHSQVKGKETDYLVSTLEGLLAVKIDRYIFVDINGFNKVLSNFPNITTRLGRNVKDTDMGHLAGVQYLNYEKGDVTLNAQQIIGLMASDANGKDDQLDRQVNIISALSKSTRSAQVALNLNNLLLDFSQSIKTNMTKMELLRLGIEFTNLRDDTIKRGYTRSSSYFKLPTTSLYGSYMVNQERLDKDISSIFFNVELFKEQARLEVFNGTNVRGLAGNRSRWISNLGGNVVKVGNAEGKMDKVYIYCARPQEYAVTLAELKKIFPVEIVMSTEKYYSRQVGDIVVVIGEKYQ